MAFRAAYTANNANNTGHLACSRKNFEDINPLPGEDKQCFCDEGQKTMNYATVQQVKIYWRSQREALRIKEYKLRIIETRRVTTIRITTE
jgi:hypothetical protein